MKTDTALSQAMANSTHGLRENFDGYVKQWQERQKSNGVLNGSADTGKGANALVEEVKDNLDSQGESRPKTKILGYGTSVAVD